MVYSVKALRAAGIAVSGLALLSQPAAANWQYTQWNMTPAEVKTASHGAAQDNSDRGLDAPGRTAQLTASYQGEAIAFKAVFLFNDESELKTVTLTPDRTADCPVIMGRLRDHYGQPKEASDLIHADIARWDDFESSNLVVMLSLEKEGCTIQYSKLPHTRSDGSNL